MNNNYFIVYQTDFDSYSIEITYTAYEYSMYCSKTICFNMSHNNLDKLIDLLSYLGFEDMTPGDYE